MSLNPLGIDAGAVVRSVVAAPLALLSVPRNIGTLVDSARVLPEVARHLGRIDDRVDEMTNEIGRMRRGVDTLNDEVIGVRDRVGPLEGQLRGLQGALEPLDRLPRFSRRRRDIA